MKYKNEVALGAFILSAVGLLAYMSVTVGGMSLEEGVHVKARFTNASGLVKDAAVMVAGVNVGKIETLAVEHDKALITLFIKKDANIRADVKASIRAKSLLGEKYLELKPISQSAPLLTSGDEIKNTNIPVEIDQFITDIGPVLKEIDPKDIRKIVHTMASSLDGRAADIQKAIVGASSLITDAREMVNDNQAKVSSLLTSLEQLAKRTDGIVATNAGSVTRIVNNTDRLAILLNERTPQVMNKIDSVASNADELSILLKQNAPNLIKNADKTLASLSPSLDKMPKLLDRLPGTLDNLDRLTNRLDRNVSLFEPTFERLSKIDEKEVRHWWNKEGFKVQLF